MDVSWATAGSSVDRRIVRRMTHVHCQSCQNRQRWRGAHQTQVPERGVQVVQDGALSVNAGDGVMAQPHGRAISQKRFVNQAGCLLLQHERPCACEYQGTCVQICLVQLLPWQAFRHQAGMPQEAGMTCQAAEGVLSSTHLKMAAPEEQGVPAPGRSRRPRTHAANEGSNIHQARRVRTCNDTTRDEGMSETEEHAACGGRQWSTVAGGTAFLAQGFKHTCASDSTMRSSYS